MAAERSLLERLARPKGVGRSAVENTAELQRTVLRNLQNLFNTRVGHAAAQMDLGVPCPSDITSASPNAVGIMLRTLRDCIGKYEPRLKDVEISHVVGDDDVLTLRFQITARVVTSKDGASISFDTVVDPAGHVRLQG
ncbi:MAG: type VI secretion system baseplate subunit TssE [Planctomycetota bacterium]|nr:MAG: type VI secretion system baseplate subunit TssE [Planctomycetota bacterium]